MSRRVVIEGGLKTLLPELAEEVVAEMHNQGRRRLSFDRQKSVFVYQGYDDFYRQEIAEAEERYGIKLRDYQAQQVIENAQKRRFRVKNNDVTEDGKIRLVLTRTVYD